MGENGFDFSCSLLPEVRFAGEIRCEKTSKSAVSCREHRLFYVLSGEGSIRLDRAAFRLLPDTAVLFRSGVKYKITTGGLGLIAINFDCPENMLPAEPIYLENARYVRAHLSKIAEEFRLRPIFYAECAAALLKIVLIELARGNKSPEGESRVDAAVSFIKENFSRDISNADISRAARYTPHYVNRLMLARTGKTLHRYLADCRLAAAEEKLLSTDEPVTAVALSVGFNNASYFAACFKKKYGVTPLEYRKMKSRRISN